MNNVGLTWWTSWKIYIVIVNSWSVLACVCAWDASWSWICCHDIHRRFRTIAKLSKWDNLYWSVHHQNNCFSSMHPENKGMIFLGFAKFFWVGADLILYFAVRFYCLVCYSSFSNFYYANDVSYVIVKFRLGIHRSFLKQLNK